MLFHEIHSLYYQAVASILSSAIEGTLTKENLWQIARDRTFAESALTIVPALENGEWPLLSPDYTTPLKHVPSCPLTTLELRWLKALLADPRAALFPELPNLCREFQDWDELMPLYQSEDIVYFDRYNNGDPYTDPTYIATFQTIRNAITHGNYLCVTYRRKNGRTMTFSCRPTDLEYSEKDDCFRVLVKNAKHIRTLRLSAIVECRILDVQNNICPEDGHPTSARTDNREASSASAHSHETYIIMELADERNALERALLHFAHFKKEARRLENNRYRITVYYDSEDESELLIRVLSFGPFLKVTEPTSFVKLVRAKLQQQYTLLLQDNTSNLEN